MKINKSATAGVRPGTQEWVNLPEEQIVISTIEHRGDVAGCMSFLVGMMLGQIQEHDKDKLSMIGEFHKNFKNWWKTHPQLNRHHITTPGGCPKDVNLVDVLEYVCDCVSAGVARNGKNGLYKPEVSPELLMTAFNNTIQLLVDNIEEGE